MEKETFEQTGLIPRSIIRTFDRFRKQLFPGAEIAVLQEFRISRYQVLVSVKCLALLFFLPLFVNYLAKTFFLTPVTEYIWKKNQIEFFLNSYQQEKAFLEMKNFEEKLYFESLLEDHPFFPRFEQKSFESSFTKEVLDTPFSVLQCLDFSSGKIKPTENGVPRLGKPLVFNDASSRSRQKQILQKEIQLKTTEIAHTYTQQSIEAITNLFGDFVTFLTLTLLVVRMRPEIIILNSFLTESIYSLSDTTKSFLLILLTDLLVGFHSPRGWEFFLEIFFRHFGFSENQDFVLLFVATFPVLLDTVFKYWIFRYLNKISPSTVATYHNMIE
jgi:hypothetical protein